MTARLTLRGDWTQRLLGVTNPTARTATQRLVDVGLVEEAGDRKWRRFYVARRIMEVLQAPMEDI